MDRETGASTKVFADSVVLGQWKWKEEIQTTIVWVVFVNFLLKWLND